MPRRRATATLCFVLLKYHARLFGEFPSTRVIERHLQPYEPLCVLTTLGLQAILRYTTKATELKVIERRSSSSESVYSGWLHPIFTLGCDCFSDWLHSILPLGCDCFFYWLHSILLLFCDCFFNSLDSASQIVATSASFSSFWLLFVACGHCF